ncbi:MAG TPA: lipid-A-disaccharide synthase [Burkholderiales bacterium]|nr:lipid-A-disaccharide synthase [Burkholderiales bacterium]
MQTVSSAASRPLRVAMVAGEASGDFLGAHVLSALKERVPAAQFFGIGGPRMQAAGFDVWWPAAALSVQGYVEALSEIPSILKIRRQLRRRLLEDPPDLFIGVDAPDFNLGLEEALHRRGVTTVHYVSPSLWAWRGERIHKMKRAVSKVLCLFPFEPEIYHRAGIPAAYVGHPLADVLPEKPDRDAAREQFRIPRGQTVVALLPGSRRGELQRMADLFVQTAKLVHRQIKNVHFLVPLISRETRRQFENALYHNDAETLPLTLLFGHAHLAMTAADVVLLASGTATLEAALLKRPMVVTYKVLWLSYWIRRPEFYLPYFALPNILAGRFVVPEILQDEATPEVLCQALTNQVFDKVVRSRLEREFTTLHDRLRQNTGERVVAELLPLIQKAVPAIADGAPAAGTEAVST